MFVPSPLSRQASISRRDMLQLGVGAAALLSTGAVAGAATGSDIPTTGNEEPKLAAFDKLMADAMARWDIPGGQLAIAHDGRLVFNRGYGYASVEDQEVVEPDARFRIASSSKPITAVAVLKLVDQGKLALDTPVFPLLAYERLPNAPYDARLDRVTVRHLLMHAGGWNSALGVDPQYLPWPLLAAHVLGVPNPPEAEDIVRAMLAQPLDFDPGTKSAYSNFGFNVLGRVIEHVSGQPYERFVLDEVLAPAGIGSMAIGGTTLEERLPGEVRYYAPDGMAPRPSVYPGGGFVPVAYGSFYLRSLDAHGGWIASASDLVRFMLAIDGSRGERLLRPETVSAMESARRPTAAAAGAGNLKEALGLGWNSVAKDGGYEWSHAGALEGSNASWMLRTADGTALAFVFNSLPADYNGFFGDILPQFQQLIAATKDWPETNLFE